MNKVSEYFCIFCDFTNSDFVRSFKHYKSHIIEKHNCEVCDDTNKISSYQTQLNGECDHSETQLTAEEVWNKNKIIESWIIRFLEYQEILLDKTYCSLLLGNKVCVECVVCRFFVENYKKNDGDMNLIQYIDDNNAEHCYNHLQYSHDSPKIRLLDAFIEDCCDAFFIVEHINNDISEAVKSIIDEECMSTSESEDSSSQISPQTSQPIVSSVVESEITDTTNDQLLQITANFVNNMASTGAEQQDATRREELRQRLLEIQKKIDRNAQTTTLDLEGHCLVHEGSLTWRITKQKSVEVWLILTDKLLVILGRNGERLALNTHTNPHTKTKHPPTLFLLHDLLTRDVATDNSAFFLVSSDQNFFYEFAASTPKERNAWKEAIANATMTYNGRKSPPQHITKLRDLTIQACEDKVKSKDEEPDEFEEIKHKKQELRDNNLINVVDVNASKEASIESTSNANMQTPKRGLLDAKYVAQLALLRLKRSATATSATAPVTAAAPLLPITVPLKALKNYKSEYQMEELDTIMRDMEASFEMHRQISMSADNIATAANRGNALKANVTKEDAGKSIIIQECVSTSQSDDSSSRISPQTSQPTVSSVVESKITDTTNDQLSQTTDSEAIGVMSYLNSFIYGNGSVNRIHGVVLKCVLFLVLTALIFGQQLKRDEQRKRYDENVDKELQTCLNGVNNITNTLNTTMINLEITENKVNALSDVIRVIQQISETTINTSRNIALKNLVLTYLCITLCILFTVIFAYKLYSGFQIMYCFEDNSYKSNVINVISVDKLKSDITKQLAIKKDKEIDRMNNKFSEFNRSVTKKLTDFDTTFHNSLSETGSELMATKTELETIKANVDRNVSSLQSQLTKNWSQFSQIQRTIETRLKEAIANHKENTTQELLQTKTDFTKQLEIKDNEIDRLNNKISEFERLMTAKLNYFDRFVENTNLKFEKTETQLNIANTETVNSICDLKKASDETITELKSTKADLNNMLPRFMRSKNQIHNQIGDYYNTSSKQIIAIKSDFAKQLAIKDKEINDRLNTKFSEFDRKVTTKLSDFDSTMTETDLMANKLEFETIKTIVDNNVKSLQNKIAQNWSHITEIHESLEETLSQVQQNIIPVGFIYVQFPHNETPQEMWSWMEWEEITSLYAGLFFRAFGDESDSFGSTQEGNAPRITKVESGENYRSHKISKWNSITKGTTDVPEGGWSKWLSTGENGVDDAETIYTRFYACSGEVRPRNTAIRIWKRSA